MNVRETQKYSARLVKWEMVAQHSPGGAGLKWVEIQLAQ